MLYTLVLGGFSGYVRLKSRTISTADAGENRYQIWNKNIHGIKCIKQIQYKFIPLDIIFRSVSRDVTPRSEETGSGASLSGSDYLFRAAGVSPKCGFVGGSGSRRGIPGLPAPPAQTSPGASGPAP